MFVEAFPSGRASSSSAPSRSRSRWSTLARELGYETVVVDGRRSVPDAARFPTSTGSIVGWPDEVAEEIGLGPNDAVAVLTHDVKFDEPAIVEALRRGCRYVGAVGSRKTQADRRARLLEAGVTEAELARCAGPIGLDLGGRAPAETALAIMAEVVAERHGASGGPLRDKARAIEAARAAAEASTSTAPGPSRSAIERPARRPDAGTAAMGAATEDDRGTTMTEPGPSLRRSASGRSGRSGRRDGRLLRRTADLAIAYRTSLAEAHVAPTATATELRER